ncbi:MAG: hypothetical protein KGS72_17100 [Cyanobacteria bacterium REEB67]|nr:hypothetical protein [Cyanobacteria bacterium REEB67]
MDVLQPEQHHLWLHTSFVIDNPHRTGNKSNTCDAIPSTQGSNLRGRRVWCKRALIDQVSGLPLCPANTGGTVAFHDKADDMIVRWDNGQISMHHKDALLRLAYLIGRHKSLQDHVNCLANRCNCSG